MHIGCPTCHISRSCRSIGIHSADPIPLLGNNGLHLDWRNYRWNGSDTSVFTGALFHLVSRRARKKDLRRGGRFYGTRAINRQGNTIELWIRETEWVVGGSKGAAVRLGLNRTTLIFRMRKLGISRPSTVGTGRSSLPNVATDGNFHA